MSLLSACGGGGDAQADIANSPAPEQEPVQQMLVLVVMPYLNTSTGSADLGASGKDRLEQDCAGLWKGLAEHQQRAGVDEALLTQINWAQSHKIDVPDLVKPQLLLMQSASVYWQPNEVAVYRYGIAQVDSNTWPQDLNVDNNIEPEQVQWMGRCGITQGVTVLDTDVLVTVPDGMAQWQDNAAQMNQAHLAQTHQSGLQGQYGKDGLGFGEHVKAGVSLHHEQSVTPDYIDSHFGVQWQVSQRSQKDLLALVQPLFPSAISISTPGQWQAKEDAVQLRISSNDQFIDASVWLAVSHDNDINKGQQNNSDEVESSAVFTGVEAIIEALNNHDLTAEQRDRLIAEHVKQYNGLAERVYPLNDDGEPLTCQRQDLLTPKGCRHQILTSWIPLLSQYLSGEKVLYMQVVFAGKIQKTYALTEDGLVQELASALLLDTLTANNDESGIDNHHDSDDSDDGSDEDNSVGEPDDTLEIMFVTQTPLDGAYLTSDCGAVLSAIQAQSEQFLLDETGMNTASEQDKMRFASELAQVDNWSLSKAGDVLYVKPTQSVRYAYGMATVSKADWQAKKIDIQALRAEDKLIVQASCDVPQSVAVMSPNLTVTTAPAFKHWVSEKAKQNQANYETAGTNWFQYGVLNVGYGRYLLGGVFYEFTRNYPESGIDSLFDIISLHWKADELSFEALSALVQAQLPASIKVDVQAGWASEGMDVAMRLANDSEMQNASIAFGSHIESWRRQAVFSLTDESFNLQPGTEVFREFINNAPSINKIMSPRDESGNFIHCKGYDTGTMNGCSQPILHSIKEVMLNTLNKESDLFIEFTFEGAVKKRYQINKDSGDITEVYSKVIGF